MTRIPAEGDLAIRAERVADRLRDAGVWWGPTPRSQGEPDGETYSQWAWAMFCREQYEQLTGEKWTDPDAEGGHHEQATD